MSTIDETPETERGRALFNELLFVHKVIRHDLATLQRLAGEVVEGLDVETLKAELEQLETEGPLWKLKVNCLRYCRFVEMHHGAEDSMLFPTLRRANPQLGPVVDRLEADHRQVATFLADVETATVALNGRDDEDTRQGVADALQRLADHLLEHLDYEEREAGPTLRRVEGLS